MKEVWHGPCLGSPVKEAAVIQGVVTTKHVLWHARQIVRDFGLRTWLSCCKVLVSGRRTTFLELVWS